MAKKRLPIGIQTFEKIINGDYLYVDKTEKIYELISSGSAYFLARPRRFGKSLLISTLNEIFKSSRNLFKNLWIYNSAYGWDKHPVIKIDFSASKIETKEELKDFLINQLTDIGAEYGIQLKKKTYYEKFSELIAKLSHNAKVVILVDEYDKPVIDNINNSQLAVELLEILRGFYTIIKAGDEYLRFVFLTGVSKFARAGVFSGLNNLDDITMQDKFADLLGINQEELENRFQVYIDDYVRKSKETHDSCLDLLKNWYNGYRFGQAIVKVYNPFSILNFFNQLSLKNYWFESGTPSFLIKLIKKNAYDIKRLNNIEVREENFSTYDVENIAVLPLLFQTGYLTISNYNDEYRSYKLGFPNSEVKNSFYYALLDDYSHCGANGYIIDLIKSLREYDFEYFFKTLSVFFANIPYDIQISNEKYYQTVFYLIFSLIGLTVECEVKTNIGRIDATIIDSAIYIFEFKFSGSKEEALKQIKAKKYYEKYSHQDKDVFLLGVEFKDRTIGSWIVERV